LARRVWITQCLCPQRHCILASAGEADSQSTADATVKAPLVERVAVLLARGVLDPWCGLCGSRSETWTYELARTRYRNMEEAVPELKKAESEQQLTASVLRRSTPRARSA
jgi:hypothetical protein